MIQKMFCLLAFRYVMLALIHRNENVRFTHMDLKPKVKRWSLSLKKVERFKTIWKNEYLVHTMLMEFMELNKYIIYITHTPYRSHFS